MTFADIYVDPAVAFYAQFKDKRDRACGYKAALPGTDPVVRFVYVRGVGSQREKDPVRFVYVRGVGSQREKDFWHQMRLDRAARRHAQNYGVRRVGKKV